MQQDVPGLWSLSLPAPPPEIPALTPLAAAAAAGVLTDSSKINTYIHTEPNDVRGDFAGR